MSPSFPRRSAAALLGVTGVLALTAAPATAATSDLADRYVALGDSFTAGPFVPPQGGDPVLCLRSGNNYPSVVADAVGATTFVDASCSAATTEHMTQPQEVGLGTENPPQFNALTEDTTLVTLGIGGNDWGFGDVVLQCAKVSATAPQGDPCHDHYAEGGDELEARIPEVGEKVAGVLDGISQRSPNATVAVVGYLQLLPEKKGCWPEVPVAEGDVAYLDGLQTDLNNELQQRAEAAGATFVDVFERGHDMCADRADKWVEGIFPSRPAAPVHPNKPGMAEVGNRVVEALGQNGPDAPKA